VFAFVPCLPEDWKQLPQVLLSIKEQTLPVCQVHVITERGVGETFPARMSDALNKGLAHFNIGLYDYLLRVDADTVIPPNFVEENLKADPDVAGFGQAMLIRVSSFMKFMGGRFHPDHDDSYIRFKFLAEGLRSIDCVVPPRMLRSSGKRHGRKYFVDRGFLMYRFGYEPIHVFSKIVIDVSNVWTVYGYVTACFLKPSKFEFADWVTHQQFEKLRSLRKLFSSSKKYLKCLGRGSKKLW
jgi:hypothetical protein